MGGRRPCAGRPPTGTYVIKLSLDFVRGQFPAFSEPSLRDWSNFDNAGESYACRYVIWRLHRTYRERKVGPEGAFPASERAAEELHDARRRVALILGLGIDEVAFGPSTAQNAYVLAQAVRDWLRPGEAIVVTEQDHEAVGAPFRRLAQAGIEIREWPMDRASGHLAQAALERLLEDGKVRLVSFPHVSGVVGEINNVKRICATVRRAGAFSVVDGVAAAPHGLPDIGALGADAYLFSAAKAFGPHQGVMALRQVFARRLPTQAANGASEKDWMRFTPAGLDHAQISACAGLADYIDTLYHHHDKSGRDAAGRAQAISKAMRAREATLMGPLLEYLVGNRHRVRLLGPAQARARTPTFALDTGRPAAPLARRLAEHGIMVGSGECHAPRPLRALGVPPERGVLRLSLLHYTSEADVDRVIQALDAEL